MSEHATVKRGEYTVPLIGIPATATEGECECCHELVHLSKLHMSESGQMLCEKCKKP